MKKIITILSASFFLAFSALAETGMIGIKYGTGELEGTQNSYDDKRSGAGTIAARTAKEDHEYGAIFGELNIPDVDGLSVGIELIPLTATLTIDSSTTDSHLELSDYTTLYGLYSYDLGGVAAYAKVGYSKSMVEKNFSGMIKALSYGAPPHGGMAPGIERIVMLLANQKNIREVTLFPLNQNAEDLLMEAPSEATEKQLKELNIKTIKKN